MKKTKLPSVIVLLILTTITTLFWISFKIYRVFITDTTPDIPEEVIMQIDPTLDVKTLNEMKTRIYP